MNFCMITTLLKNERGNEANVRADVLAERVPSAIEASTTLLDQQQSASRPAVELLFERGDCFSVNFLHDYFPFRGMEVTFTSMTEFCP